MVLPSWSTKPQITTPSPVKALLYSYQLTHIQYGYNKTANCYKSDSKSEVLDNTALTIANQKMEVSEDDHQMYLKILLDLEVVASLGVPYKNR